MFAGLSKALAVGALAGALFATSAQAACWQGQAINAAKVRDMQTMMMVGALRCRNTPHNPLPAYNRFIGRNRLALSQGNDILRRHFMDAGSGQAGYDRFTTSLANSYGAGLNGVSDCAELLDIAERAAAANGRSERLLALADELGVQPVRPSSQCRVPIAAR